MALPAIIKLIQLARAAVQAKKAMDAKKASEAVPTGPRRGGAQKPRRWMPIDAEKQSQGSGMGKAALGIIAGVGGAPGIGGAASSVASAVPTQLGTTNGSMLSYLTGAGKLQSVPSAEGQIPTYKAASPFLDAMFNQGQASGLASQYNMSAAQNAAQQAQELQRQMQLVKLQNAYGLDRAVQEKYIADEIERAKEQRLFEQKQREQEAETLGMGRAYNDAQQGLPTPLMPDSNDALLRQGNIVRYGSKIGESGKGLLESTKSGIEQQLLKKNPELLANSIQQALKAAALVDALKGNEADSMAATRFDNPRLVDLANLGELGKKSVIEGTVPLEVLSKTPRAMITPPTTVFSPGTNQFGFPTVNRVSTPGGVQTLPNQFPQITADDIAKIRSGQAGVPNTPGGTDQLQRPTTMMGDVAAPFRVDSENELEKFLKMVRELGRIPTGY